MGLETATFVQDLDANNPASTDKRKEGDNHIRVTKGALKSTFPNATKPYFFPVSENKAANYAILATEDNKTFVVDTTAGEITLSLPALTPAQAGWTIRAVKTSADANLLKVAPTVGSINGGAFVAAGSQYQTLFITWTGLFYVSAVFFLTAGAIGTASILDEAITFPKMQNINHGKRLGRQAAGVGDIEEVTDPVLQCQMIKVGSDLLVRPWNGNLANFGGVLEQIPSAGVALSTSGLTAGNNYYIYLFMNGAVMTLEASVTPHVLSTTTGLRVKNDGNNNRLLVGLARTAPGPAWADTPTQRFVRSWQYDFGASILGVFTASRPRAAGAGFAEIHAEIRCEFITWTDEVVSVSAMGSVFHDTAGGSVTTAIGLDGTAGEDGASFALTGVAGAAAPIACAIERGGLAEGLHFVTLVGQSLAGAASYRGGANALAGRCSLMGRIKR